MLHEVLLALSGHPTPLFGENVPNGSSDNLFPLLAPSEKALLLSIGRLSELHRKLKRHLESIASTHESVICRAVATAIRQGPLSRFQKKILSVESKMLTKDVTLVGAYDIVPLASIVGEFDDWHRLMAWYWQVATFMSPLGDDVKKARKCTSARLIDKLQAETQTGFPEIEDAAIELARTAEIAWLRQLSSWVIYGKLPTYGARDFFIRPDHSHEEGKFTRSRELAPDFVTPVTANSLLFIGKSLHQAEHHHVMSHIASNSSPFSDSTLASTHLQHLFHLRLPIIPSQFSRAVSKIRFSLSQNVLQHLLPMSKTVQLLTCLRQFLLLGHGDFAIALIAEAEGRIQTRQQNLGALLAKDPVKALHSLSIKDAELHQVLRHVWRSLAAEQEDDENDILEYAQSHMSLINPKAITSRPSTSDSSADAAPEISPVAFNNLLFPNPTELTLTVSSPMDLFLSTQDVETYSAISSYLLAIRRGHQRLAELWKRTAARRDHPLAASRGNRARNNKRNMTMRKVWATCSSAIFMLSETAAFFEGEVIRGSCEEFQEWVESPPPDVRESTPGLDEQPTQRDPETLASGHRAFLASLTYALLLTDTTYTKELRSLLGNVDHLIAYFTRLFDIQQKLDLEQQAGRQNAHTAEEEQKISLELDRARKKVDSDLKSVINRLRQLDQERIGSMRYLDLRPTERGDFEVWKGGGVDRLLMKLEFGRMVVDGYDATRM